MTTERLRELLAAATPGPWGYWTDFYGNDETGQPATLFISTGVEKEDTDRLYIQNIRRLPDAALIVALVNTAKEREDVVDAARAIMAEDPDADVPSDEDWAPEFLALRDALTRLDAAEKGTDA